MEQDQVTGCCYTRNVSYSDHDISSVDQRKIRKSAGIIVAAVAVGLLVFSLWTRDLRFLFADLLLWLFLAYRFFEKRFGYSDDAAFTLSESCIQTDAVSKKMCRRFSWAEVSVIQNARIGDPMRAHPFPEMVCYVFVRGQDNALLDPGEIHSFRQVVSNPNRIVIPKDSRTVALVTAIAEKFAIPVEHTQLK